VKVLLIADDLDIKAGTGVSRYAAELARGLTGRGVQVDTVLLGRGITVPTAVEHCLLQPVRVLSCIGRYDVVHATKPVNALSFPLIKRPKVMTYHDVFAWKYKNHNAPYYVQKGSRLYLGFHRYCDKVIAQSSQTKREVVEWLGVPPDKVEVIGLGVKQFASGPVDINHPSDSRVVTIGFVGRLVPRKRVGYLIEALAVVREIGPQYDFRLKICGDGPDAGGLRELAREKNVSESVDFCGFLDDDALTGFYRGLSAFIFPSEWEGFGLPILEAQSFGIPVITMKDGKIPPETKEGTIQVGDIREMAREILRIATDHPYALQIRNNAFEHAKSFTWESTVEETIKLYCSLQRTDNEKILSTIR
jgi:glycosyltransferase involved in cell wall biosynthesis